MIINYSRYILHSTLIHDPAAFNEICKACFRRWNRLFLPFFAPFGLQAVYRRVFGSRLLPAYATPLICFVRQLTWSMIQPQCPLSLASMKTSLSALQQFKTLLLVASKSMLKSSTNIAWIRQNYMMISTNGTTCLFLFILYWFMERTSWNLTSFL